MTGKVFAETAWIVPDWPAPRCVHSLITTRHGGVSLSPYDSLNLGDHVGDDPLAVAENRRRLNFCLPSPPHWLNQVHGCNVVDIGAIPAQVPTADAAIARQAGFVCAVMTADCLPVLLCHRSGSVVAAVHAGWRGLLAGVLDRTVADLKVPGQQLLAYFGPAIGPQAFEVGAEVRRLFLDAHRESAQAFKRKSEFMEMRGTKPAEPAQLIQCDSGRPSERWLADLYLLGRQALARCGVTEFFGGQYCTLQEANRFFSFRRDGVTGRMVSLIWLADE